MSIGAKELIVEFLSATAAQSSDVPVQVLLRAASVFGIGESSVRVALVRLRNEGRVVSPRRGVYALGDASQPLHQRVATWREGSATRAWDGTWIAASYQRTRDRSSLRRTERALKLWGFRELETRFAVRPHNLALSLDELRDDLHVLGLEEDFIGTLSDLGDSDARARALWDGAALDAAYDEMLATLTTSRARVDRLALSDAVRESFEIGREAIRLLVLDPLLPEPLVRSERREAVRDAMRRYDAHGSELWSRFILAQQEAA